MWFLENLAASRKLITSGKKGFDSIFGILLLLKYVLGIFQREKTKFLAFVTTRRKHLRILRV
jgi:hypothetical protein